MTGCAVLQKGRCGASATTRRRCIVQTRRGVPTLAHCTWLFVCATTTSQTLRMFF